MVTQSTINVPVIPDNSLVLLDRPRIDGLLSSVLSSPVATIVAGSGYGKTEAVYSFLRKQDLTIIWVQVSEHDNEMTRFWGDFSGAIFSANKDLSKQMLDMGFPYDGISYNKYADAVSDALTVTRNYALVIDDFHNIHNPDILKFFERGLQMPLANMHRIFISRENPSIVTANYLLTDHFAHLNEDDLRFTRDEMKQLFALQGLKLSPDTIEKIYSDTDGWVFAIQLIGLFFKRNPGQIGYAVDAMKSNVSKLIDTEIFSEIPEKLQHFLIKMSLINHLYPDLLRGLDDGEACMNELRKMDSFVRYDDYLNTYRIHQLFLDYLKDKQRLLSEQEKRSTLDVAANWCLLQDDISEAIHYYEELGDYDRIVELAYKQSMLLPQGVGSYILNIFRNAPAEAFERNGTMTVVFARLLIALGHIKEGENFITSTIERYEKLPESGHKDRILCGLYNNLGFLGLIKSPTTSEYDFAAHFMRGDEYFRKCDIKVLGAVRSVNLSPYITRVGKPEAGGPEKFIEAVSESIPYISHSMNGCMYGMDDLARAELSFFRGELENCEQFSFSALYKARERSQYEIENRALFFLLRTNLANGKYEKVRSILYQIEAQPEMSDYATKYFMKDILTSWFYAQIGHTERMADWITKDFEESEDNYLTRGLEFFTKNKFYMVEKRYHRLLAILESQDTELGIGSLLYGKIGIMTMKAICLYHLKERKAALRAFEEAYTLAIPNALDMIFISMGNDMRVLSGYALKNACNIPRDWLETIGRKSSTCAKRYAHIRSNFDRDEELSNEVNLSSKELEVLTDLAHGLSRSEIATARNISINTVKTMLPLIFRKLDANSTIDAIRIAVKSGIVK
ncbi:MAG: LuxR C-terminal-related transcriptional regulator [Clostridiales Family XIII bacterium]|jgi:LuxR family maltose regulon positive regulatory protein|nr:LuxR C-terminal-related transcriptional regulator [Clostridiales Family XIII bacterium]